MAQDNPRPVFVSHSRSDDEGRLFLHDLFASYPSNHSPYFYSLDNPTPPHVQRIRERIQDCRALVVLLSPQMETPHTHSWVAFEVGIAAAKGVPIVVVEPEEALVNLPVPGATHYLRRPRKFTTKMDGAWKVFAETACNLSPTEPATGAEGFWDGLFQALYNVATADVDSTGAFHRVTCKRDDCRSPFYVPVSLYRAERHPCPACRDGVASLWVQLTELSEEAQRRSAAATPAAALPGAARKALPEPTRRK